MNRSMVLAIPGVCLAFLACGGDEVTRFPPGLEPLEASTAPEPPRDATGALADGLAVTSGEREDYDYAHARAVLLLPIADVYRAARTPEVNVDRRAVARYTVTSDVEPSYSHSFRTHNEVESIVTVTFENTYRFGSVEGPEDQPTVAAGSWQKTFGTSLIEILRGSIVLRAEGAAATRIEIVYHVGAFERGTERLESFVRDYFASIRAAAHGEALPTY